MYSIRTDYQGIQENLLTASEKLMRLSLVIKFRVKYSSGTKHA